MFKLPTHITSQHMVVFWKDLLTDLRLRNFFVVSAGFWLLYFKQVNWSTTSLYDWWVFRAAICSSAPPYFWLSKTKDIFSLLCTACQSSSRTNTCQHLVNLTAGAAAAAPSPSMSIHHCRSTGRCGSTSKCQHLCQDAIPGRVETLVFIYHSKFWGVVLFFVLLKLCSQSFHLTWARQWVQPCGRQLWKFCWPEVKKLHVRLFFPYDYVSSLPAFLL